MCKLSFKPVFHQKRPSRWVDFVYPTQKKLHKQHEMYMASASSGPSVGAPMQPIFHLLTLGGRVGANANFKFRVGGNTNSAFLDTNMLVFLTQNSHVWGIANTTSQRECFCITAKYRLKEISKSVPFCSIWNVNRMF